MTSELLARLVARVWGGRSERARRAIRRRAFGGAA
jgi:hypothetical protein